MDEVAERLRRIIDESGPRSFAAYVGTASSQATLANPFVSSLLEAVGSKMLFTPNTLDKPGKSAGAGHARQVGRSRCRAITIPTWPCSSAPTRSRPTTAPRQVIPGGGCASAWPGRMQLLVIDPRRSDVAKKATMHLRPYPGHDPAILACLIGVVLAENIHDASFVEENARGLDDSCAVP